MDKIGGSVQRVYQPAIVFRSQAAEPSSAMNPASGSNSRS